MPRTKLYFAYSSLLDPDRLMTVAPGASFKFPAHYPETRLVFASRGSEGPVPTLMSDPGHTVWGGVFEIPEPEVQSLYDAEETEGRVEGFDHLAVDRAGNKHDCLTFVSTSPPNGELRPAPAYLASMIKGAKHWSLPAGWVMGLEDLTENPLFG